MTAVSVIAYFGKLQPHLGTLPLSLGFSEGTSCSDLQNVHPSPLMSLGLILIERSDETIP
jgi:hypothetical protein